MENTHCPYCGEKLSSNVAACPRCTFIENSALENESLDREVYLNAMDLSAPENYPGY